MKLIESQGSFQLIVILTDAEAVLYGGAFRTQRPVSIPEFGNKKFIVENFRPCEGEALPQNSWRMVIKQVAPDTNA